MDAERPSCLLPTKLVLTAQAVFLFEHGHTDRQTHTVTNATNRATHASAPSLLVTNWCKTCKNLQPLRKILRKTVDGHYDNCFRFRVHDVTRDVTEPTTTRIGLRVGMGAWGAPVTNSYRGVL